MGTLTPQDKYLPKLFTGSSHAWALKQLDHLAPQSRILDVGPGSGLMGKELRKKGFSEIYGVEIDPAAREFLQPVYNEIHATIDPFADSKFDLILLLDVLEHMVDPFAFLSQATELLAPGGTLLVSVPNVAHWSVRFPLLFGFFEYTNRAILDKTHLQFFNRRRFKKLIGQDKCLSTVSIRSSIEPSEFVLPAIICDNKVFKTLSRFRRFMANLLPGLLAYQHLARLQKMP